MARELGISDTSIHQWRKELTAYGDEAFPGSGHQTAQEEELRHLKRELEVTRQERDILKKSRLESLVFQDIKIKYTFVAEHCREYSVKTMCRVLSISESGYYAWRKREPSQRQMENEQLTELIFEAFQQGRQVYGSLRVHAQLRAQGIECGKHRVVHLMRQAGLWAVQKRRRVCTTDSRHSDPVAPNRKWLTDITAVWTARSAGCTWRSSWMSILGSL